MNGSAQSPGNVEATEEILEGTVKLSQPDPYQLKQHILSPLETLAQSVSAIAPSATPTLTVPLVFALAGEGTWLAYLLALGCIGLVALCIAAFAHDSASPGSLYIYTRNSLPPVLASLAAWALFFAYVTTAASVTGGFMNYAYELLGKRGAHISPLLLDAFATGGAVWLAGRDVKMSTRMMLWIEAVSVCLISFVIGLVLWRHGLHWDAPQIHLRSVSATGVRLGVVLALFSFVGFESATALGAEAREPLKTIPRAVIRSALLAGVFFLVCAYGQVLGFRGGQENLGVSTAPFRYLATRAGVSVVGVIIDAGVLVTMFASTLACTIAAARVLMLMAHHGLAHERFSKTHAKKQTPGAAGLLAGLIAFLPVAVLSWKGTSPEDIYGWMGTLSVYGFLTIYGLVAIALPIHLKRHGRLNAAGIALSVATTLAMVLAMAGNILPLPDPPIRYFPLIYLAYLIGGTLWYFASPRRRALAASV
jgi:amino acid transporter